MQIWQYRLLLSENKLQIPARARPLSAQLQDGQLTLWAAVQPENALTQYRFWVFPTGEFISDDINLQYIDTVQIGPIVVHVMGEA
jgi:hypothetical protein